MVYLKSEEVVAIHDLVVEATGGSFGVREQELLESIIVKPQTSFGGYELYPDVYAKAAAFYEALSKFHVFVDGNKRTAVVSMYRFLAINGYDLTATNEEIEEYTVRVAASHLELDEVATWIKDHCRPKG